jgi:hypothetical protein
MAAEVDIGWGDVLERLVVATVVVVLHEAGNLPLNLIPLFRWVLLRRLG